MSEVLIGMPIGWILGYGIMEVWHRVSLRRELTLRKKYHG